MSILLSPQELLQLLRKGRYYDIEIVEDYTMCHPRDYFNPFWSHDPISNEQVLIHGNNVEVFVRMMIHKRRKKDTNIWNVIREYYNICVYFNLDRADATSCCDLKEKGMDANYDVANIDDVFEKLELIDNLHRESPLIKNAIDKN